ncbi:MAG: DNA polymerase I [Bdellovibrionales bacterium]|nr:DNA polymerase I [Bdellovibrionales bacterium]
MGKPKYKQLIVVDLMSFIFRAFYAIRHNLTAPDGTPTNAVSGVLSMLQKLFSTYPNAHFFIARDSKGPNFRHEIYDQYKANRTEPPEELIPQFDLIDKMIRKMNLHVLELPGFEADDIIGSVCTQWVDEFEEILVASGDKDLMQFVGNGVKIVDTMKNKIYDEEGVFEKMGVRPDQIVDYLSMVGDSSDNIPGMKGIGAKGAAKLLAEYGSLDECIKNKEELKGKKLTEAFSIYLDQGLLSKKLIEIKTDLDLETKPENTKFSFYPSPDLMEFLTSLGFKTIVQKLKDLARNTDSSEEGEFKIIENESHTKIEFEKQLVDNNSFKEILKRICEQKEISFHTEYTEDDFFQRKIFAISVAISDKESFFFPFQTSGSNLKEDNCHKILKTIWGNKKGQIYTEHSKRDVRHALIKDIPFDVKIFDLTLAHYVSSSSNNYDLKTLAKKYLGHEMIDYGKKKLQGEEISIDQLFDIMSEKAIVSFKLGEEIKKELKNKDLQKVYDDIDEKLIPVLAKMEKEGVLLNSEYLKKLEKEFQEIIDDIESEVAKEVKKQKVEMDGPVNLRSPKQVSELLFEKLEMPVITKTKTGYSTASDVLEELVSRGLGPLPSLILNFREVDKLQSTYVKALPKLINPTSHRLHTNFSQHTAATGRLASVNPNLQNIPARSDLGKKIRKAFIATPGRLLFSADYSQVELRLLAHFSEDPTLVQAFLSDQDIHTQTAAEVLGIAPEKITKAQRESAKAVNFGLMYGQSSFGLAKQLGISRKEAKDYITSYFNNFGKVKGYLDSLKDYAEEKGYCETFFGRKRFLPDIHSKNRNVKAQAERMAINSPIQGTAADIIKLAMISIDKKLTEDAVQSKMLLQVHDELIFEVIEEELVYIMDLVKNEMENVVKLKVPLKVASSMGVNWFDLK